MLRASQQGQLDGLCGIYAAINALRLVYAPVRPLSPYACRNLFSDAISYISQTHNFAEVARYGMDHKLRTSMLKFLLSTPTLDRQPKLIRKAIRPRPRSIEAVEHLIRETINSDGVLIASLHGRLWHASVISGQTPKRITLFDSSGMKSINKASLSFEPYPHREKITLTGLVMLRLA